MKFLMLPVFGAWLCLLGAPLPQAAAAFADVDVEVIRPDGRAFPVYRHGDGVRHIGGRRDDAWRAWLQAEPGAPYALRLRNRTGARVGLVIAVDGRNIINGRRSTLAREEAMYVLGPWQSGVYRGWRTGWDQVNEFYFTRAERSYAGAFDDYSAMGLISVAVFPEAAVGQAPRHQRKSLPRSDGMARPQGGAGTGFGDERRSPSRGVEFEAARRASSIVLLRYEWRETLCEMGVIDCRDRWLDDNRLWDRTWRTAPTPFAPPPPRGGAWWQREKQRYYGWSEQP